MKTYIWLYILGVCLGLVIGFVLCDVAKAKTASKAASIRITEAFAVLPRQALRLPEQPRQSTPYAVWFKPPSEYIADRPAVYVNGKLMIYRECEVDAKQDPGENSCKMVFAWI